ncbi:MAG: hypothetical protein KGL35_04275, partial [Bradyrhizobium sp.]|nr:hypothetical protein [Bradyrhizobium sp.]
EEEAKAAAKVKAEQEAATKAQTPTITPEPPPPAAPAARVSPAETVIEHQDEISRFLNSKEWGRGERDRARAILVEFVKFTATAPAKKAA